MLYSSCGTKDTMGSSIYERKRSLVLWFGGRWKQFSLLDPASVRLFDCTCPRRIPNMDAETD